MVLTRTGADNRLAIDARSVEHWLESAQKGIGIDEIDKKDKIEEVEEGYIERLSSVFLRLKTCFRLNPKTVFP